MPDVVVLVEGGGVAGQTPDIRVSLAIRHHGNQSAGGSLGVDQVTGCTGHAGGFSGVLIAVGHLGGHCFTDSGLDEIASFAGEARGGAAVVLAVGEFSGNFNARVCGSLGEVVGGGAGKAVSICGKDFTVRPF